MARTTLGARRICLLWENTAPWMADFKSIPTLVAGALHRYGRQVPQMTPRGRRAFKRAGEWFSKQLPSLSSFPPLEEYFEDLTKRRGAQYVEMIKQQCDNNMYYNAATDGVHKSFVKREFYPEPKHARSIQGPKPHVRPYFGEGIHYAEKAMVDPITWVFGDLQLMFVKRIPIHKRPQAIDDFLIKGKQVLCTDHTAFEAHMTKPIMEMGELKCLKQLIGTPWGAKFGQWHKYVTATQKLQYKGVSIKLPAFRCSGNPDTSLSNAFENVIAMLAISSILGLTLVRAVVEGDDGLFQFKEADLPTPELFVNAALECGFEIKPEFYNRAGDAGFCQLFWASDQTLVPNPIKKLVTLQWTHSAFMYGNNEMMRALFRAKLLSLSAEAHAAPIIWALLKSSYQFAHSGRAQYDPADWFKNEQLGPPMEPVEPSIEAREFCARQWNIPIDTQFEVEHALASWKYGEEVAHTSFNDLLDQSTYGRRGEHIIRLEPYESKVWRFVQ